jgi:hypothetical protein
MLVELGGRRQVLVKLALLLAPEFKTTLQSSGPFSSSGASSALLTRLQRWPPFQVVSTTHTPSPTDGKAPVRISSLRARSLAWIIPPFRYPEEAVGAAPCVCSSEHSVGLRLLVADELHRQLRRVGPRDGQLPSKRRIETVVGHQHNVPQLLTGVLDRLVDQRDLLAKPEAKPVRTDWRDPKKGDVT